MQFESSSQELQGKVTGESQKNVAVDLGGLGLRGEILLKNFNQVLTIRTEPSKRLKQLYELPISDGHERVTAKGQNLPLPDQSIDHIEINSIAESLPYKDPAVLDNSALLREHYGEVVEYRIGLYRELLKEVFRVLKPGGRIEIQDSFKCLSDKGIPLFLSFAFQCPLNKSNIS